MIGKCQLGLLKNNDSSGFGAVDEITATCSALLA